MSDVPEKFEINDWRKAKKTYADTSTAEKKVDQTPILQTESEPKQLLKKIYVESFEGCWSDLKQWWVQLEILNWVIWIVGVIVFIYAIGGVIGLLEIGWEKLNSR